MVEETTSSERSENWREWSTTELAQNGLDFQRKGAEEELRRAESNLSFDSSYQPRIVSRPAYIEQGGMDAADWDAAEAEAANWSEEQGDLIEHWRERIESLNDDLRWLHEDESDIKKGDPWVIDRYSQLEKARREKEEELRKARQA